MMYLADTNIFLEILLSQEKRGLCEKFLSHNIGKIVLRRLEGQCEMGKIRHDPVARL
jgi:hypothetical protein